MRDEFVWTLYCGAIRKRLRSVAEKQRAGKLKYGFVAPEIFASEVAAVSTVVARCKAEIERQEKDLDRLKRTARKWQKRFDSLLRGL